MNIAPINIADPVARHHPLNQGRVGWWLVLPPLDGGRLFYDLMGLNPGVTIGMTSSASGFRSTNRHGGFGHLLFDGVDDHIYGSETPRFNFLKTSPFSGAFWFKTTDTGCCFVNNWNLTVAPGWRIDMISGSIRLLMMNSTGSDGLATATTLTTFADGTWRRFLWTYSGSNTAAGFKAYMNGVSVGLTGITDADPGAMANNPLVFGAAILGGLVNIPLAGTMDDITLWNRTLSASDVLADYNLSRLEYPGVLNRVHTQYTPVFAPPPVAVDGIRMIGNYRIAS